MPYNVTYETEVLERKLSELATALVGRGGSTGEVQRALTVEAGQCAWQIASAIGPRSKPAGVKTLDREMRSYLTYKPKYSNLSEDQQQSSTADFTWLAAGRNFLVGINDEDNQLKASDAEALQMFYGSRKALPRGNAWQVVGSRGKQSVLRLNRTRISQSTFNRVRKAISDKFGEAKASFAATAAQYLKNKSMPAWIASKIPAVRANGKHVLNETGLNSETNPFIEFGSRARGVESNPRMQQAITAGIVKSSYNLSAKIKKVIAGYTYNWNTGQIYRETDLENN